MLTFDPGPHEYRWNGRLLTSVSRLLAPIAGDLSKIPVQTLERKRSIGHALHLCVHLHHDTGVDPESVDDAVRPYFDAYLEADAVHAFKWTQQERPIGDPLFGYAGTPDAVGTSQHVEGEFVADWKTTAVLPPHVGVQLAGYRKLLKRPDLKRYVLWLTPNTRAKYQFIECKDTDDDAAFMACLALHNWRMKRAA